MPTKSLCLEECAFSFNMLMMCLKSLVSESMPKKSLRQKMCLSRHYVLKRAYSVLITRMCLIVSFAKACQLVISSRKCANLVSF